MSLFDNQGLVTAPLTESLKPHLEPLSNKKVMQLELLGVSERNSLLIKSFLRVIGSHTKQAWAASERGHCLVVGLDDETGHAFLQTTWRKERRPVMVCLQSQQVNPEIQKVILEGRYLVLYYPIRHISLAYCLDVMAERALTMAGVSSPETSAALSPLQTKYRLINFPPMLMINYNTALVRVASELLAGFRSPEGLAKRAGLSTEQVTLFIKALEAEQLIESKAVEVTLTNQGQIASTVLGLSQAAPGLKPPDTFFNRLRRKLGLSTR
jgi:hypothetical protein